jgi:hypothetical protein
VGRQHAQTKGPHDEVAAHQRHSLAFDIHYPAGDQHHHQRATHEGGVEKPHFAAGEPEIGLREGRERWRALHNHRYRHLRQQRKA